VNFIFFTVTGEDILSYALPVSVELAAAGLFFLAVILPIIFWFGVEKGRLLMMLLLFAPTAGIVLLSKIGVKLPDGETVKLLLYLAPFAALAVLGLSVIFSLKIYEKKEM
jgi:hypothetical protein